MGSRGGGGSNGGGSQGIPSASRRMIQSLKEIVNGVPEAEIYSTLKDCNMDPNEAVNRLLSQDPFHEVKSKREKKKEFKDSTESRTRGGGGGGGTSNRGARSGTDRYAGRGGSNHFSSSESGGLHGKPTYKRENETSSFTSSTTSASKVAPRNTSWNPPSFSASDSASVSVSQPSSGYQSAWSGAPGQKSMADIVKMGRPQNNPPPPQTTTHNHAPPPPPPPTVSDNHASSPDNEWPSIEQPHPQQPITESTTNSGQSNSQFESNNQFLGYETNEVEVQDESSSEDEDYDNDNENENESHEGNLDISLEEEEEDDVPISSVTANIHEENHMDPVPPQEDDDDDDDDDDVPSVVIPDHLQVHTADCSHLSFGSFGANMNQGYSGHFTSAADAEPEPVTSSVEHSETTNLEYYEDGSRTGGNAESYEVPSASQTALKQEDHHHHHDHDHEVTRGNEYGFPPTTHTHTTFDFPQSQTQSQISTPFMNAMSANGHPHPVRESDLSSYSQFSLSVSQSMPTRYANSASPINDPTISMAEALKNVGLTSPSSSSSSQPTQQPQHTPASAVPQHLTMHPYSQPNLPLGGGHFTNMNMNMNMMSYPFLPQSYTYMPSGFQPSTYHQQLAAAILPHYKNNLNLSTQSPTLPSGYASSGNYEDVLNAHYKELQQNEWARGGGSRSAVPANAYYSLQSQNHQHQHHQQQQQQQAQPPSGFRQPAQGYGGAGGNYPEFFHSQAAGVSQEQQLQLQIQLQQQQQQQQNPRDGGGSQQKLQSQQQLWQNGY